jgi:hypothetical protein
MTEPNAALTYGDLILAVAERLGVAFYGANGDQAAQIPDAATMPYELDRCKRFVQDGIRMFMADAPPNGWRWQRPLAEIDLWQEKGIAMPPGSAGPNLVTSAHLAGTTHVYATSSVFNPSDVGLVLAVRSAGLFTIAAYVSTTEVTLTPGTDWSWQGGNTFVMTDPTGAPTMTIAYNGVGTNLSTITADPGTFYPSTEGKTLFVTDLTSGSAVTLLTYLSNATMEITDTAGAIATAWGASARTFNLSSQGIYALPQNFGGEVAGEITYQAGSNRGVPINWISELEIRRLRENWNSVSGNPYYAAVRRNNDTQRRWDLVIYPNTGGTYRVEFPFIIYFDKISALTDMHVAGFQHDEAVKAAAMAQAELQGEDVMAGSMQYYRTVALPNSYRVDGRSAARRLGYCGNPRSTTVALRDFRQYFRRPSVTYRQ